MKKSINKDFIPVIISIVIMLVSIGVQFNTQIGLSFKDYLGVFIISIFTFLYFWKHKWFTYSFGMFLLIGSFALFNFFHINLIITTTFFKINLIFLVPLIMLLAFNKELKNLIFPANQQSEEEVEKDKAEKEIQIKNFERRFSSIPESELKSIAEENSGYVDAARIASKNLLKRKYML